MGVEVEGLGDSMKMGGDIGGVKIATYTKGRGMVKLRDVWV